jgi:hypothetical protein
MNPRLNDLADNVHIINIPEDIEELEEKPEVPDRNGREPFPAGLPFQRSFFADVYASVIENNRIMDRAVNNFMYSNFSSEVIFRYRAISQLITDLIRTLVIIEILDRNIFRHVFDSDVMSSIDSLILFCSLVMTYEKIQQIALNADYDLMNHVLESREQAQREIHFTILPDFFFSGLDVSGLSPRIIVALMNPRIPRRDLPPTRITWISPESNVNQAGYSYLMTSREHQLLQYFLNRETFLFMEPVNELNSENRCVLDGYAFSIDELVAYAQSAIHAIFRNPHLRGRGSRADFSDMAHERLKNHPALRQYILNLENHMLKQFSKIQDKTLTELISMLNKINLSDDSLEWTVARANFIKYVNTLNKWQQKNLYDFVIEVPCVQGGFQRMNFKDALDGGPDDCVYVLQIFLWQFVIMHRPQYFYNVPAQVHDLAALSDTNLRILPPKQAVNTHTPQLPARRASMPTAFQSGTDNIRFFSTNTNGLLRRRMPQGPVGDTVGSSLTHFVSQIRTIKR